MKIIGVNNDMYISSACILENGKIIAAGAEERFSRVKQTRAFPVKAIEYCLKEADVEINEIDYISFSWNPAVYFTKYNPLFSGQRRHHLENMYSVMDNVLHFYDRPEADYVQQILNVNGSEIKVYQITHHRCHAANGFLLSPFEHAAIMTADSQGEFESTTFCRGSGNTIELLDRINYPHSLGMLYSTFTEFLGFKPNSDEWKVMAMGAFCDSDTDYFKKIKNQVFKTNSEDRLELDLTFFNGYLADQPNLYSEKFVDMFGHPRRPGDDFEQRHYEIARALQSVTEDVIFRLLNSLYDKTLEKNLVVSGGVFMNSVLNGKILENTPFEKFFVTSCPDDSGNCFGAALYLYNHILDNDERHIMTHNFYGPLFSDNEIESVLSKYKLSYFKTDNTAAFAAKQIFDGKIIGWFQGRMEFGQRALGNRSILADPRSLKMKDKVNQAIKYRESFRPFAPAVLEEKQHEYFNIGQGGNASFMEKVYSVKNSKMGTIDAVTHVDGTARIQSVGRDDNEKFYNLIEEFEKLSGIPIVLNTSFNLNGEPIVCTPTNALKTFYSCGLDLLILNDYVIEK
jgi:carbamoyltransferase